MPYLAALYVISPLPPGRERKVSVVCFDYQQQPSKPTWCCYLTNVFWSWKMHILLSIRPLAEELIWHLKAKAIGQSLYQKGFLIRYLIGWWFLCECRDISLDKAHYIIPAHIKSATWKRQRDDPVGFVDFVNWITSQITGTGCSYPCANVTRSTAALSVLNCHGIYQFAIKCRKWMGLCWVDASMTASSHVCVALADKSDHPCRWVQRDTHDDWRRSDLL